MLVGQEGGDLLLGGLLLELAPLDLLVMPQDDDQVGRRGRPKVIPDGNLGRGLHVLSDEFGGGEKLASEVAVDTFFDHEIERSPEHGEKNESKKTEGQHHLPPDTDDPHRELLEREFFLTFRDYAQNGDF